MAELWARAIPLAAMATAFAERGPPAFCVLYTVVAMLPGMVMRRVVRSRRERMVAGRRTGTCAVRAVVERVLAMSLVSRRERRHYVVGFVRGAGAVSLLVMILRNYNLERAGTILWFLRRGSGVLERMPCFLSTQLRESESWQHCPKVRAVVKFIVTYHSRAKKELKQQLLAISMWQRVAT